MRQRLLASSATALVGVAPASSQTGPPTVSISPIEGRIGTQITAMITNCEPPTTSGGEAREARLDFAFEGLTPSTSSFFSPAEDGSATVTIETTDKEGQSEKLTVAEVVVSQCGNEGFDSAPFTVTPFPTIAKPAVVRGNTWFLRNSNTTGVADMVFTYGNSGDLPIVGDWDTNDTETPGVVRGNVRYLRNSNSAGVADVAPFAYGNAADEHLVWTAAPG